jgi:hypothetical protein
MGTGTPLLSLERYARFVADLLHRPEVERSTLTVWSTSPYTGVAEGEVFFIGADPGSSQSLAYGNRILK